jgi:UDP-glucuronate 4-epimerase
MKKYDVKKLIFASSSSVYGNNKKVPFSEKDNVDFPISPYAASKKAAELLCHTYHHLYDFEITCLRFFTVYGPRQRPDLAIHKFTKAILNEEEIQMYGVGTSERDYTYIDDIVDGITKAIINLQGFNIYNLGESRTIKLRELIKLLEQMIGKKARIKKLPEQPGDVDRTFADISKARKEIGYSPKFEFEEGLRNFIKWYKEVK